MSRTKTLDAVIERAAALPEPAQQELAEIMAEAIDEMEAQPGGVYRLNDDERRGIERGLAAAREGQFATDEEVAAVFSKARASR
jgi:predicted transcriptional regulator